MRETHLAPQYVMRTSPLCPTCGKKMEQISATPTSEGVTYDFLCSNDGDLLSWRPGHLNKSITTPILNSSAGSWPARQTKNNARPC